MAREVVEIPVPELDVVVRPRLERCAPERLPADPDVPVAHIAILGPLAGSAGPGEGTIAELRQFFADVTPFPYQLVDLHRSTRSPRYAELSPDPVRPFRRLALGLSQRFPEHSPYGARPGTVLTLDVVTPHLSVPLLEGEPLESLEAELADRLPATVVAREARLFSWHPDACGAIATFPFGTSAA